MSDAAIWGLVALGVSAMALSGWLAYLRRDSREAIRLELRVDTLGDKFDSFTQSLNERFEGTARALLTSTDLLRRESDERLLKAQLGSEDAYKKVMAELAKADEEFATEFERHVEHVDQRCTRTEQGLQNVNRDFHPTGKKFTTIVAKRAG